MFNSCTSSKYIIPATLCIIDFHARCCWELTHRDGFIDSSVWNVPPTWVNAALVYSALDQSDGRLQGLKGASRLVVNLKAVGKYLLMPTGQSKPHRRMETWDSSCGH